MQAGQLTERIRIETPQRVADGYGGETETWTTTATVWAEVKAVRGREPEEAGKPEMSVTYLITIRRRSDLTAADRIVWTTNGNTELNLREIRDQGPRHEWLTLVAESGVRV